MRLFVLAITLAIFASLAATPPAYTQDANPELAADLQKWLVGSWMCRYSRSMRMQAIYGTDKQFEWIFHIGMVPYATTIWRILRAGSVPELAADPHIRVVRNHHAGQRRPRRHGAGNDPGLVSGGSSISGRPRGAGGLHAGRAERVAR